MQLPNAVQGGAATPRPVHDSKTRTWLIQGERALKAGEIDKAIVCFDRAVSLTVDDSYALYHLATALGQRGLNGAAINLFMRSISNAPEGADWALGAWCNFGVAFRQTAHEDLARKAFDSALELDPTDITTLANYAGSYVNAGEPAKGIEWARRALEIDPYNSQAAHHLGLLLLEAGEYAEGWAWYQSRLRLPEFHTRPFKCDMWGGEHVDLLAIHGEQGIGDEILFASLIDEAKARVGRVVIECQERLIPIFERSFNVPCYATAEELLKEHEPDAFIPMGSLPFVFKVTKPLQHTGYLKADPAKVQYWKDRMLGRRIGVSWRGGTVKTHEHLRNFSVEHWKPLIECDPLADWVSVQYDEPRAERDYLGLHAVAFENFDEHFALVAACDHVVTVCNTTVHMAGSLNVPVSVLVPSAPAWRYGIEGDRMLWYPSAKLYRQKQNEPWSEVIERIKANLARVS